MTDISKVRALYGDFYPDEDDNYLIDEFAITIYLDIANGNYFRAAAMACRAIASNEVLLKGYLRTDDLTVDGVKGAAELRLMAKDFEARAQEQEDNEDDYGAAIVFPENCCTPVPEATPPPLTWRPC